MWCERKKKKGNLDDDMLEMLVVGGEGWVVLVHGYKRNGQVFWGVRCPETALTVGNSSYVQCWKVSRFWSHPYFGQPISPPLWSVVDGLAQCRPVPVAPVILADRTVSASPVARQSFAKEFYRFLCSSSTGPTRLIDITPSKVRSTCYTKCREPSRNLRQPPNRLNMSTAQPAELEPMSPSSTPLICPLCLVLRCSFPAIFLFRL